MYDIYFMVRLFYIKIYVLEELKPEKAKWEWTYINQIFFLFVFGDACVQIRMDSQIITSNPIICDCDLIEI